MKRTVLIGIPAVLVVLVVILLVAPGFIDWNQYKGQAQDQIKTATGFTAELRGPISMAILPTPHLSIADVQIIAPEGSSSNTLALLGRADVHLAFIPLLSGQIAFDSITLVEPQIALEVLANGKQNWMTPELERMKGNGGSAGAGLQVSVKKISIDKGSFTYTDRSKSGSSPLALNDVNIDAAMDTLKGPFKIDGSFALSGRTIKLKATTGAIDETGAMTVKAEGTAKPGNIDFAYAGVVTTAEPFQLQGETSLDIASLADLTGNKDLGEGLKLKGMLTATQQKLDLKNAAFALGDNNFSGDISTVMNPLKITGDLKASDTVSLDKFIKGGGSSKAGGPLLPATLTMPMPIEAGIKLSAPAISYQKQTYKNVTVMVSKQDAIFALDFAASGIPGQGKIDAKAALKYASKSASQKDGSVTYSEPALVITLKGDSQNLQQTAEAVSGMEKMDYLKPWKTGAVDGTIAVGTDALTFKDTTITLDQSKFNVAGSYGMTGTVDMTVTGQASDAKTLMQAAGMDASALPKSLEGAVISVAAKGSRDKVTVNADIKAMSGDLIAKADVADPFGKPAYSNFVVQAKHPNLADAMQKFSPASPRYVSLEKPLDFYAEIEPSGKVYSLKNMKVDFAGSPVTGTVSIDTGAAKPTIKADLVFQTLTVQTQAAASGGGGGGNWSSEVMDTAWLKAYEADLDIKADSIVYQSWSLQKPVIKIAMHNGALDVKQFDSSLFGGQMNMTASVQGTPDNKGFSSVQTSATFRSVSLEELTKALVGTRIIKASGDVNLKADLSTSGISQAALVGNLKGDGTTDGKTLVFQGFDLHRFAETLSAGGKPGDTLQGLFQSTMTGGSTAFDTLDGNFSVTQGIVNIAKMDLDSTTTNMATQGTVNLPPWMLQTTHTVTMKDKPDLPPFTIKMAGSLSNPAQSLGQGVLNNYLSQKINSKLDKLIGDKLGSKLGLPGLQQAAPSAGEEAVAPAATQQGAVAPADTAPATEATPAKPLTAAEKKAQKKQQQQEAIQGLLKGVLGGQ